MSPSKLSYCGAIYCAVFFLVGLLAPGASMAVITYGPPMTQATLYHGSLTAPDGLHSQGRWSGGLTTIEWWVSDTGANGWWNYKYQLTHPVGNTSHMIIGTSTNFTLADVTNAFVNDASGTLVPYSLVSTDIKNHTEQQGNVDMPTDLFGIKFDRGITGLVTVIQFDSQRIPTWGDFYSKDGGNDPVDAAWNLGFADADPLAPPASGSLGNHLLVPDTTVDPIPEPGSWLLFGAGLLGLAGLKGRRKRIG